MRILVYCDEDLNVAAGGARQVLEFAKALAQRGHTVKIVAPEPIGGRFLADSFTFLSFQPVQVWRVRGLRPLSFLLASWAVLRNELARWKPDRFLWFDSPGQIAPLSAMPPSIPVVLFVNGLPHEEAHGVWRLPLLRFLLKLALRASVRRAQAVVSVCQEVLTPLQLEMPLPSARFHVVRNGVDTERFVPQAHDDARAQLGLKSDGLYVGFVGGFFPWHGLDQLIDAVPMIREAVPNVIVLLVGDGQTKLRMEQRARRLGVAEAIQFAGRADWAAVPTWIAACDVCVALHQPTRSYPGDSMKLWEYLACGRAVVATAGPGYGDFVEAHGCGMAVRPNDVADLSRQIVRLLQDRGRCRAMGDKGRQVVLRGHTWGERGERLESILTDCGNGGRQVATLSVSVRQGAA